MRYYEFVIFCDHRDCQTETVHCLWATSWADALRKARIELVRHHGWCRTLDHRTTQPVDLCQQHHPLAVRKEPNAAAA